HLPLLIRSLRCVLAGLINEAFPNVDIDDSGLLGPTAVKVVEVSRVGSGFRTALRGQTHPDHWTPGARECIYGGIDTSNIGELPFVALEFPRTQCRLPRLRGHIGGFRRLLWLGRLLFCVGR